MDTVLGWEDCKGNDNDGDGGGGDDDLYVIEWHLMMLFKHSLSLYFLLYLSECTEDDSYWG